MHIFIRTQDVQFEITNALAFIQLNQRFSKLPFPKPPNATSEERRILSILDWIASFFVRDPIGDCVASALSVDDRKITLYLTANRGRPDDEDDQNGNRLISTLRQAFHDPQSATRLLFNSAISITYRRFYRKLDMVKNTRFPLRKIDSKVSTPLVPPIEMFEKLVTKWTEAKGVEKNRQLINCAQTTPDLASYESGKKGNNALMAFFKLFVEMIDSQRGLSDLLEKDRFLEVAWAGFCMTAILLVFSDFFSRVVSNDVLAARFFNADEHHWLRKLKQRLWRIARYRTDADSVATTGIKWIKRILGDEFTESGFRVVWVVGLDCDTLPKNHGMKHEIRECPQELFKKFLRRFGFNESTQNKEQTYMTDLGSLWSKPNFISSFVPFLHCELQLISYLERHNIAVHMNLVGVSKLMCLACNAYVEEVNMDRKHCFKEPYNVLSGTSGKAHHAWLIPPGDRQCVVVAVVRNALKDAISSLAEKLGHQKKDNDGSDSSPESTSPYESDEEDIEEDIGKLEKVEI